MVEIHKTLETSRLSLVPMDENDASMLAELGADPDVVKTLICDWSTPENRLEIAKYWIEKNQEHGIWGVFDRGRNFDVPQDFIGFFAADEPLAKGGMGPEIYYAFRREAWGKGVASEVVSKGVEHLIHDQGVSAVEALVLAGVNPASTRLLEKNGMNLIGRYSLAEYAGEECIPTVEYELWRVETSAPESAKHNLEEAAFKIGQFVADGISSRDKMNAALVKASTVNSALSQMTAETIGKIISDNLNAGMKETGWLHYRIMKSAFLHH
jgi:RimJ/RimL family protein N-acetyltransferase